MLARACASESGFAFFAVSAASLTSKWVGEGEKMMRALFTVARDYSPSIVFFDEVDSLLSKRKSSGEHEASRRMKTEFLVQLDGAASSSTSGDAASPQGNNPSVVTIACTNLPWDLDDAALRRFARRIYIPLPDETARRDLILRLLSATPHSLSESGVAKVVAQTAHYSASDITNLCKEASMAALRSVPIAVLQVMDAKNVPPTSYQHFEMSLKTTQPSVSKELLQHYIDWEKECKGA